MYPIPLWELPQGFYRSQECINSGWLVWSTTWFIFVILWKYSELSHVVNRLGFSVYFFRRSWGKSKLSYNFIYNRTIILYCLTWCFLIKLFVTLQNYCMFYWSTPPEIKVHSTASPMISEEHQNNKAYCGKQKHLTFEYYFFLSSQTNQVKQFYFVNEVRFHLYHIMKTLRSLSSPNMAFSPLTLTLPGPSAGVSGSLDSYCSLKPLCSGMGEVVPARTSPILLPPSPRTVLSLSCFKVSQCINWGDWHFKS